MIGADRPGRIPRAMCSHFSVHSRGNRKAFAVTAEELVHAEVF